MPCLFRGRTVRWSTASLSGRGWIYADLTKASGMSTTTQTDGDEQVPKSLFAAREKVYPKSVAGKYRKLKWIGPLPAGERIEAARIERHHHFENASALGLRLRDACQCRQHCAGGNHPHKLAPVEPVRQTLPEAVAIIEIWHESLPLVHRQTHELQNRLEMRRRVVDLRRRRFRR